MRYLITCDGHQPALTGWFEPGNHFNAELNMIVYDLLDYMYYDGSWHEIQIDHL